LAELAAEKARIGARLAQLNARKTYVNTLLPLAQANSAETQSFVETLQKAEANGLVRSKTLQELMAARVQASERHLSLQAEQSSLHHRDRGHPGCLQAGLGCLCRSAKNIQ